MMMGQNWVCDDVMVMYYDIWFFERLMSLGKVKFWGCWRSPVLKARVHGERLRNASYFGKDVAFSQNRWLGLTGTKD